MKTPVKTDTANSKPGINDAEEFASHRDPLHKPAPDRDVTKADVEPKKVEAEQPKQVDPRGDIKKQIDDHEKWMADHTDDARGVQERLQEVALLHRKLAELEQPKHETRLRQAQAL